MDNELFEKLLQLQWLLRKNRFRGYAGGARMADTTQGQGRILAVLKLRDGISTRDLSFLLGVQVSSLNELLAKMEKNGYVTREPSEKDKRVMLVKLTEKGRGEEQADSRDSEDIFACLSEEEQEALGHLLDKLIAALHTKDGEEDDEMRSRMKAVRERFGEMPGAPFGGGCGRGFHGGFGHAHRFHRGFPGGADRQSWFGNEGE